MEIYIKDKVRRPEQFQFFIHQFVEAFKRRGISVKREIDAPLGKLTLQQWAGQVIVHTRWIYRKRDALIVASSGNELLWQAYPYQNYTIIPMLWDVWPKYWETLHRDLRLLQCPLVFVTVRAMVEKIKNEWGIPAYWCPEGIDPDGYTIGNKNIDVYELGRQKTEYHRVLQNMVRRGEIREYRGNCYGSTGELISLAFPTDSALKQGLSQSKIVVSFPQNDTHPTDAGDLETLTQRYWEAMLSKCLIIGRAPQELIDFVGYNPVIDVDWNNPERQLSDILSNMVKHEPLIKRNREVALAHAPWDSRVENILSIINKSLGA